MIGSWSAYGGTERRAAGALDYYKTGSKNPSGQVLPAR
jgi:hypothetical protein